MRRPPSSTLFPYPPLFRSVHVQRDAFGLPLDDVGEHDGLEDVVLREPECSGRAVETGTDDGDLALPRLLCHGEEPIDRKSTRLNSSHANISYAVFCLKKIN